MTLEKHVRITKTYYVEGTLENIKITDKLSLDAGTLIHFLDFVVSLSSLKVKPLLFDSREVTRLGVQEYGSAVLENCFL